jgi:dsRNA-specific ribonuclease
VNGYEKGIGIGKNIKLAKEEAARDAWVNMGW